MAFILNMLFLNVFYGEDLIRALGCERATIYWLDEYKARGSNAIQHS